MQSIHLASVNLTRHTRISPLTSLRELKLYDNRIARLGTTLQPLANNLNSLDLSSNRLLDCNGLSGLRSLKLLNLSRNQISSLEGIGRATQLESLDLSCNKLRDLTGISSCIGLKQLSVSSNLLTSLAGLQRCQALEELLCTDNQLSTLSGLKMASKTLDVLDASNNQIASLEGLIGSINEKQEAPTGHSANIGNVSPSPIKAGPGPASRSGSNNRSPAPNAAAAAAKGLVKENPAAVAGPPPSSTFSALTELYLAGNKVSIRGLICCPPSLPPPLISHMALKLPNLETLDLSSNPLSLSLVDDSSLQLLACTFKGMEALTSIRLFPSSPSSPSSSSSNMTNDKKAPDPKVYALKVFELLGETSLDSIDDIERPPPPAKKHTDILSLEGEGSESQRVEGEGYEPTIDEMEAFKAKMGIKSQLPVMGKPAPPPPPLTSSSSSSSKHQGSASRPPSAHAMLRSSITNLSSSLVQRPGTASGQSRPSTASTRPGSSSSSHFVKDPSALNPAPKVVKDVMMHQRVPSARTGGSSSLLTPEQYADQVANFKDTMDQYSSHLRSTLKTIKEGLKLNVTAAQEELKQPGAEAARKLPDLPRLPEGDIEKLLNPSKDPRGGSLGPGGGSKDPGLSQKPGTASALSALPPAPSGNSSSVASPPVKAQVAAAPAASDGQGQGGGKGKPAAMGGGLIRNPDLDAPEIEEAMKLYQRLFPAPSTNTAAPSSSQPPCIPATGSSSLTNGPQNVLPRPTTPLATMGVPPPHTGPALSTGLPGGYLTPLDSSLITSLPAPSSLVAVLRPSNGADAQGRVEKGKVGDDERAEEEEDDREVVIRGGGDDDNDDNEEEQEDEVVFDGRRSVPPLSYQPSLLPVDALSLQASGLPDASATKAPLQTSVTPQKLKARLPQGGVSPAPGGGRAGGGGGALGAARQTPPRRPLSAGKRAGAGINKNPS